MNSFFKALAFLFVCSVIVFAGNSEVSRGLNTSDELDINNLPAEIAGFVPSGYVPLKAVSGDLNLDRLSDVILVVKKADEEELDAGDKVDGPKRPLLILLGQPGGTYKLAAKNENTVYCYKCGGVMGDPFQGVTIKKGYFSVEHYGGSGWRWSNIVTYKYSPTEKNWFLYKLGNESFHASDPEKVESKVRTAKNFGKVRFDKYDIYKK